MSTSVCAPPPSLRDAYGSRSPSRSQSAASSLPALRTRAQPQLEQALGRRTGGNNAAVTRESGATSDSSKPATDVSEVTSTPSASAPAAPASASVLGVPVRHLPYGALSIDASWSDLMSAYRTALLVEESAGHRRSLHEAIVALFRKQPNVHASEQALREAEERARRPPLAATATSSSTSSSSPAQPLPAHLTSPINANTSLPASFIAPSYRLSEHNILACLSARSCLDQFLRVRAYPPGSIVLLSAINIPDVSVVLRAHQLVPVPVDLDLDTLGPNLAALERALQRGTASNRGKGAASGGRVVAVMVAHLYGRRCDMTPVVELVRQCSTTIEGQGQGEGEGEGQGVSRRVDLIEDLAEAFSSSLQYVGHPASDLSFLSFGSIKIATAFGGGVARVRDSRVWAQMKSNQEQLAVQARKTFFTKCVKNTFVMLSLNVPLMTGSITRTGRAIGFDHKEFVISLLRGFPDKLMERLREQPSAALLETLRYRLANLDMAGFQLHQDRCDLLVDLLPSAPQCIVPGYAAPVRNHWLLPVMMPPGADHMSRALALLNENGVDAYRGATQLALVPMPPEEEGTELVDKPVRTHSDDTQTVAASIMSRTLYLPMHRNVPEDAIVRMAFVMHKVVEKLDRAEQQTRSAATAMTSEGNIRSKL